MHGKAEMTDRVVKISVTAEDIKDGKPKDCANCPLAIAIRRATGDSMARVYGVVWAIGAPYSGQNGILPENAIEFYHTFDDGEPVFPFEFEITIPG